MATKKKSAGKKSGAPAFTAAEVEALNLRIKDLEGQLSDEKEAHFVDINTLSKINDELEESLRSVNEKYDSLLKANKALETAHGEIKRDSQKIAGGKFDKIPVPAMANKKRAVSACHELEETPSCKHARKIIARLRLFIEDHCT